MGKVRFICKQASIKYTCGDIWLGIKNVVETGGEGMAGVLNENVKNNFKESLANNKYLNVSPSSRLNSPNISRGFMSPLSWKLPASGDDGMEDGGDGFFLKLIITAAKNKAGNFVQL